jgi:hypothetical protein
MCLVSWSRCSRLWWRNIRSLTTVYSWMHGAVLAMILTRQSLRDPIGKCKVFQLKYQLADCVGIFESPAAELMGTRYVGKADMACETKR